MTTLQTVDGRLLRAQRPAGLGAGSMFPSVFPPLWSDGTREPNGLTDGKLVSFERIYRSQPVLAAVVDKLTRRVATLPFDVYQPAANGSREIVEGDSLDSLVRHPMPRWGTVHLLAHVAQSLFINANAVLAKVRTGNDPEAPPDRLWPLDWGHLSAYGQVGGTIEVWSTTQFNGEERFLSVEDTVHFAWPGPEGNEIGVSPLEKLGVTIQIEDAAQRHQTSMFRNGVRPSAAVSMNDPNATKEKLDYAGQVVKQAHGGVDKAGAWVWLGANTTVQPLTLSPVEAALIDQRKLNREEIGMVYDLAGPLMNDLEHGTFSNVSELLRSLYRDVVPPWASLIEETFKAQLIDVEPAWLDREVCFDFTDKLKGDPVELANSLKIQVEAGLITRNEARRILNMPPVDDDAADKLTYNANNQAPIDFHRNTEVLTTNTAGTEVNPPAVPSNPPSPGVTGR